MAADITIDGKDTSRLRLWVQNSDHEKLHSISAALITLSGATLPEAPKWMHFALEDKELIDAKQETLHEAYTLVNYSKLEVIESQSLPAVSAHSIRDLGGKFNNKLVIIGDGTIGQATDTFIVPGRSMPVTGVYLHASGVYSLTIEPFYELRRGIRLLIDFSLAFAILLSITIIRWKKRGKHFDWQRTQRRFVWGTVLLSIAFGILAVRLL